MLQQRLRPTIANRTKVVSIVGACLVLLAIPGLLLTLFRISPEFGAVLIFAPLIINVVGMVVLVAMIGCMKNTKKLSETNRKRQQYVCLSLISMPTPSLTLSISLTGFTNLKPPYQLCSNYELIYSD